MGNVPEGVTIVETHCSTSAARKSESVSKRRKASGEWCRNASSNWLSETTGSSRHPSPKTLKIIFKQQTAKMSWKEIIKKCLGFCADSQKCQLLCVHVPAGHDQFYRDYTTPRGLYTTTCSWNSLSTSMWCVPLSPSSPRRCAGVCVPYYTLYYIVQLPPTPIAT